MKKKERNYSNDPNSLENYNDGEKYDITGESSFSREVTVPFDMDDVMSERHIELKQDMYGKDLPTDFDEAKRTFIFRGKGPNGYRRKDESIKHDVCEALTHSSSVDATEIEVSVDEGLVYLKGTVSDRRAKKIAEREVETLSGVIDVINQLTWDKEQTGLIDNRTGMS